MPAVFFSRDRACKKSRNARLKNYRRDMNLIRLFALSISLFLLAASSVARAAVDYVDDDTLRGLLQRHLERFNSSSNKVSLATLQSELNQTGTVLKVSRPLTRE